MNDYVAKNVHGTLDVVVERTRGKLGDEGTGVMLPCNVIVQETADAVEIVAMDPVAAMGTIGDPDLQRVATEVKARLNRVVEAV